MGADGTDRGRRFIILLAEKEFMQRRYVADQGLRNNTGQPAASDLDPLVASRRREAQRLAQMVFAHVLRQRENIAEFDIGGAHLHHMGHQAL